MSLAVGETRELSLARRSPAGVAGVRFAGDAVADRAGVVEVAVRDSKLSVRGEKVGEALVFLRTDGPAVYQVRVTVVAAAADKKPDDTVLPPVLDEPPSETPLRVVVGDAKTVRIPGPAGNGTWRLRAATDADPRPAGEVAVTTGEGGTVTVFGVKAGLATVRLSAPIVLGRVGGERLVHTLRVSVVDAVAKPAAPAPVSPKP